MGRKLRVFYSGALYHVIQRGNNKNFIYKDDADKEMFFNLLLSTKKKYDFKILYYVLMDNHYHMILESGDIPISKGLQLLNASYSKYYNKKYNRSGGIYEGRYASLLITSPRYYYRLLRYIAWNPVKSGIVENAKDYKWGAHQSIRSGESDIINIDRTLSYFSDHERRAFVDYMDLIEYDAENKLDYGLLPQKDEQELCDSLDHILWIMGLTQDTITRLKEGDKSPQLAYARNKFIMQAYSHGYKIKEIANHISYSYESIRAYIKNTQL